MGPITLFDKSFLQSLRVDESVWFDAFFITVVCPIFYVETLADLSKSVPSDRTPEREVQIIAEKFPSIGGMPCSFHEDLVIGELLGYKVPMDFRVPISGGHRVRTDDKDGAVFEHSPESQAFSRWQKGEYRELDYLIAQHWRKSLVALDLTASAKEFKEIGITPESCKTLKDAKSMAEGVIGGVGAVRMKPSLDILGIPKELYAPILSRWHRSGNPLMVDFAPYTAHVMTVDLFFNIALAANLISSQRPSNRVDVSYLYYLPFCQIFVSTDRLHQRCAPLFLRDDQGFVWGQDFKIGLGDIDEYYKGLPESEKEGEVYSFARVPPDIGTGQVAGLWDRFLPGWRERVGQQIEGQEAINADIMKQIENMKTAVPVDKPEMDADLEQVLIKRSVRRQRGSWTLISQDEASAEDELD
jgi:hypothetical protein